jgi:hypothetical protein
MSFYKNDNGTLLCGPNFVENANYSLRREIYDTYTYPIDGWYWFETDEEARKFFGLPEPQLNPAPMQVPFMPSPPMGFPPLYPWTESVPPQPTE